MLAMIRNGVEIATCYGAKEFAVILARTGKGHVIILAERLGESAVSNRVHFEGMTVSVTLSVGVATYPAKDTQGEDLILTYSLSTSRSIKLSKVERTW